MRRSVMIISLVLSGCQSGVRTSPLESKLVQRSTTGVGTSLSRLQKQAGKPPFWQNRRDKGAMTVYIKGPKSLWGSIRVVGANLGRTEVSSMRARLDAEEDGVIIRSSLSSKDWPDVLVVTYTVQGETYQVDIARSPYISTMYVSYPDSLKLGKRRIKPPRITSSTSDKDVGNGSTLIAVEHDGKETVRYYLSE